MYSTQMRRHKITRTLLIFFTVCELVTFLFGAPVAVRKKLEGCIDSDGTVTAALQKRGNPVAEWSTNIASQTPSSPDRTEVDQLWEEMRKQGILIDSPAPLYIPGWSSPTFSDSSTGSTDSPTYPPLPMSPPPLTPPPPPPLPVSPPPLTPPPPPPPPASPPPLTPPPPPTLHVSPPPLTPPPGPPLPVDPPPLTPPLPPLEKYLPPALPLTTDKLSTTGHQPTLQQNLGPDLDVQIPPNPELHPPAATKMEVDEFLDMLMKGLIKRTFPAPML